MPETAKYAAPIRYCYPDNPEPARSRNLEIGGHVALVTATIPVAGPPPAPWLTLKARLDQLQSALASNVLARRLTDQVLHGGDELDTAALLSLAVAERSTHLKADIASDVHLEVLAALHQAYEPCARSRYVLIASRFDAAARRFTELAETCGDVEAPAGRVLASSANAQAAYKQAPAAAAELDAIIGALSAAAELCGAEPTNPRASFEIASVCDTSNADRRAVWLAWHGVREVRDPSGVLSLQTMVTPAQEAVTSRCGKWSGLLAAGAVPQACPNPAALQPFQKPKPRFVQYTDEFGRKLSPPRIVDPEAVDAEPERERSSRVKKLVHAFAGRGEQPAPADDPTLAATVLDSQEPDNA
jgi:hypothetical protein